MNSLPPGVLYDMQGPKAVRTWLSLETKHRAKRMCDIINALKHTPLMFVACRNSI